jgi:hypothetical protein
MCLKNRNKIKMNGKEAKLYAIWMGSFEFNASPRIKYIANITQIIPIRTYLLAKRITLSKKVKYDGGFTAMFRRKPKKIVQAVARIINQSRPAPTLS